MSTILHCVQSGAFTAGCAAINGRRARPDVVAGLLLAEILARIGAFAAVASPQQLPSARLASATVPTFPMFAE